MRQIASGFLVLALFMTVCEAATEAKSELNVVASDPEGETLQYLWERVSGPGSVTFSLTENGTFSSTDSYNSQPNRWSKYTVDGVYTMKVTVKDPQGLTTSGTVDVIVLPPLPEVSVAATDATASEPGSDTGRFTLTRTGSTATNLTVFYAVSGTAASGSDYVALSGSVTIPAGASTATVTVTPVDNTTVESTETVVLTLSANVNYAIGTPGAATVSILDNDSTSSVTVTLTAPDVLASEPGSDTGRVNIKRTGSTASSLTVSYSISGTATNGTDYVSLPGNVTIPAGSTNVNVYVTPIEDSAVEGKEFVTITLSAQPAYNVGSPSSGSIDIVDNDFPIVTVKVADAWASEGASDTARFRFARTGSTASSMTVSFTKSGSATNGSDYASLPNSVTIPVGATYVDLTVSPLNDSLVESRETIVLGVTETAAYQTYKNVTATAYLLDDELPVVSVSANDPEAAEPSNTGQWTISRTGSTAAALTVNYTRSGTATSGTDFTALSGSVVIPAGATNAMVTLTPINDSFVEGRETVLLKLAAHASYQLNAASSSYVYLYDDEKPWVTIKATDASASEPGTNTGTFTLTRIPATSSTLSVGLTKSGTATAGSDYVALPASATFAAGAATTTLTVTPIDDTLDEVTETVLVATQTSTIYQAASTSAAKVNISDND